ncbi:hypothetical protein DRF65_13655 [Chryseobacterium pennae]|uniref:Uncharacterized protein n=1 Tax=Chryseobacterium pennae TaxID=2258962 RepID=A0A3D9C7Q8_9FLAO|nr:hypothetical protein [Chryseobacterium pennae]REC61779.1 hypothetical protein DRF65_13655 [Chryseobacterium pennae]
MMAKRRTNRNSKLNKSGSRSEGLGLEHFVKLDEFSQEQSMQMLKDAGLDVGEEEAAKIMEFLYLFAKITIKEIFTPDENFL